ncbi:MAG: ABC transporter substrate-binding protein [Candidatus Sumerlaeia bacterium]
MEFPYGKAPLALLLTAVLSGLGILMSSLTGRHREPDLVFAVFAKPHYESYLEVLPDFEKKHNVKIQIQLVENRALTQRLQSALMAGSPVPDIVEIPADALAYFCKGPLEDIGFVDLTERIEAENLDERMVAARFSLWSSRGRIFAMPHDVHPVTLAYRADIVEGELGIDPEKDLRTWDDFAKVGQRITRDLDGDGVVDRYMIDLPSDGGYGLAIVARQRGTWLFDAQGNLTMNDPEMVDVITWYVKHARGDNRIAFAAGWGQTLARAMQEGLALFYLTPDWRTKLFENEVPDLAGKMKLMPLPAWKEGDRRTSVWGGTGLAITKQCENPDLAWELAKFLYLKKEDLAKRFAITYIIPPVKEAWDLPEFHEPVRYYSNQPIGRILAELAPEAPPEYTTPYSRQAGNKLNDVFLNAAAYYESKGEEGLREFVKEELQKQSDYVQNLMDRNKFLTGDQADDKDE